MSLKACKASLVAELKRAMSWDHTIVEEYAAWDSLPSISVYTAGHNYVTINQSLSRHDLTVELTLPVGDADGAEFHRDPGNLTGLAGAMKTIRFDGSFVHSDTTLSSDAEDTDDGEAQLLFVTVTGDLYVRSAVA